MIETALMKAMVEQAPTEARKIQNRGPNALKDHVSAVVERTRANLDPNPTQDDPAGDVMMREMVMADAMAELSMGND